MNDSTCPQCDSKAFKRNGYTRHGKQNHRCLDCGRQFSVEPQDVTEKYPACLPECLPEALSVSSMFFEAGTGSYSSS